MEKIMILELSEDQLTALHLRLYTKRYYSRLLLLECEPEDENIFILAKCENNSADYNLYLTVALQ